jgi:hypothetical protein
LHHHISTILIGLGHNQSAPEIKNNRHDNDQNARGSAMEYSFHISSILISS